MIRRAKTRSSSQRRTALLVELLEDRRLLSASLLGAHAPVFAAAPVTLPSAITTIAPVTTGLSASSGNGASSSVAAVMPTPSSSVIGEVPAVSSVVQQAAPVVNLATVPVSDVLSAPVQQAISSVNDTVQQAPVVQNVVNQVVQTIQSLPVVAPVVSVVQQIPQTIEAVVPVTAQVGLSLTTPSLSDPLSVLTQPIVSINVGVGATSSGSPTSPLLDLQVDVGSTPTPAQPSTTDGGIEIQIGNVGISLLIPVVAVTNPIPPPVNVGVSVTATPTGPTPVIAPVVSPVQVNVPGSVATVVPSDSGIAANAIAPTPASPAPGAPATNASTPVPIQTGSTPAPVASGPAAASSTPTPSRPEISTNTTVVPVANTTVNGTTGSPPAVAVTGLSLAAPAPAAAALVSLPGFSSSAAAAEFTPTPAIVDLVFQENAGFAGANPAINVAAAQVVNNLIPQMLAAPLPTSSISSGTSESLSVQNPARAWDWGLPLSVRAADQGAAWSQPLRTEEERALSPRMVDLLAELNATAGAGLEQMVQQLLHQLESLQRQFGDLLAGLGMYHWLFGLAVGAAACSLYLRNRRRQALAYGDALVLGPEFIFFAEDAA